MRKCRNVLVAALAGAIMLIAALPASAHDGKFRVRTDDPNPGGEAYLYHKDGWLHLRACDIQKDGYGVRATAGFGPEGTFVASRSGKDTDGANNGKAGCGKPVTVLPGHPGYLVTLKVCLKDRDGNRSGKKKKNKCRWTDRAKVRV
jgi:hypothetical protein